MDKETIPCPHCQADLGQHGFMTVEPAEAIYGYRLGHDPDGEETATCTSHTTVLDPLGRSRYRCGQCDGELTGPLRERLHAAYQRG